MKKILVAPLDWGLGHATRCIPIIRALLNKGCDVLIGGSGNALALLKAEFPSLITFELPAYNPEYPAVGQSMVWKMAAQLPKFIRTIAREHQHIEKIITAHSIDLVISDNRYGCWSAQIPSVFITHQSNILMPERFGWLRHWVSKANAYHIRKFTVSWIPDFPGDHSMAGALIAFGKPIKGATMDFIGPLSRFSRIHSPEKKYDIVAICSGPEPQRSVLENLLLEALGKSTLQYLIVRGITTACRSLTLPPHGKMVNFLTSDSLQKVLSQTDLVIARSGYSTVMDMAALGKKAVFIPTPGQTEQAYLAQRLAEKKIAFFMPQDIFNLPMALTQSAHYTGFAALPFQNDLLAQAIEKVLALQPKRYDHTRYAGTKTQ